MEIRKIRIHVHIERLPNLTLRNNRYAVAYNLPGTIEQVMCVTHFCFALQANQVVRCQHRHSLIMQQHPTAILFCVHHLQHLVRVLHVSVVGRCHLAPVLSRDTVCTPAVITPVVG